MQSSQLQMIVFCRHVSLPVYRNLIECYGSHTYSVADIAFKQLQLGACCSLWCMPFFTCMRSAYLSLILWLPVIAAHQFFRKGGGGGEEGESVWKWKPCSRLPHTHFVLPTCFLLSEMQCHLPGREEGKRKAPCCREGASAGGLCCHLVVEFYFQAFRGSQNPDDLGILTINTEVAIALGYTMEGAAICTNQ